MIEVGSVTSESTNLTARKVIAAQSDWSSLPSVNEGANVPEVELTFGDFLDMINPFQHIPVISSIYRAIAGETITPSARIAGDVLFGGPLGIASAGISAMTSVADEIFTASNDGTSITETVIASLFGGENSENIQVAQAPAPEIAVAEEMPGMPLPSIPEARVADLSPKAFALDTNKLPYGGVMETSTMATAQANQALALALAGRNENLQAQRVLRNSRFEASPSAAPPQAEPATQAAMQNLALELQAMKSLDQYKAAAQMTPIPGSSVDVTN